MDGLTDENHGHPHYLALDVRDRALVRAILLSALRHHGDLSAIVDGFMGKPLPAGASPVRHILVAGLAQILFLDVPDHSAADLAVTAANDDPRTRRFGKLVNALLRRASREKDELIAGIRERPRRSPPWFAQRLETIYGQETAAAIDARHRIEAPIDITLKRSEQRQAGRWAERLGAVVLSTGTLRLEGRSHDVASLSGYTEGAWWVQDAAAAIPARLFGDISGKRALDLCAAPGGKTAQLADGGAQVTALDASNSRLKRLRENMSRLKLADALETVASDLFAFRPDAPFENVLLDAPCSSTGTVRRHPDVPFTKSMANVEKLASLQARMLDRAAEFVAPGGMIIFSNCSLDSLEGEDVASAFAESHPEFESVPVLPEETPGLSGSTTRHGFLRLTPAHLDLGAHERSGVDGFFAARFRRISVPS
nr:RsmB/NOP family class I SAM-dependent RNA methyltransferase [Oricola cellulosilytica]